MMQRRTKIIATLGPATDDEQVIADIIEAGVNLVRLNFSHGNFDEHRVRVERVRKVCAERNYHVGILGDLQGAKIRVGRFRDDKIILAAGDRFVLDADLDLDAGHQEAVGLTYKELIQDIIVGDKLLLDDGRIVLVVDEIIGNRVKTTVDVGGELSSNKGINRMGGGLSAASLTEKDREDILHAAALDVDYLAVSFVKTADDVHMARKLMQQAGGEAGIVAKIERAEALDTINEIMEASEVIMIARGDLGVEIGDADVPGVQKSLISQARETKCLVITATQMMESMITNAIPTRAEMSDVANAVLDGTDAVMLSGETAIGAYPVEVVEAMNRVCLASERQDLLRFQTERREPTLDRVDEGIAMAAMFLANHLDVAAIAALTESGSTALWMSRINSTIPVYAFTRHVKSLRRVTLYRGVFPVYLDCMGKTHAQVNRATIEVLQGCNEVKKNDLVILTKGDLIGVDGGTNAMKILRVGHLIEEEMDPEST